MPTTEIYGSYKTQGNYTAETFHYQTMWEFMSLIKELNKTGGHYSIHVSIDKTF